jgi:hypothetical protein
LIDQKFLFSVFEIDQKLFVIAYNLCPFGRMEVAIGLLGVRSENRVELKINVMRYNFKGRREIFFGGKLGVAGGNLMLIERIFGLYRRGILTMGQGEVET